MKTQQIKFWIPETKQYLVFALAKEYDEEKVMETINGYYREYLDPDEAGVDEEALDEIETSSITSWIINHMYDCGDYDIEDVTEINVRDDIAKIINHLMDKIAENREYYEDSDDCDSHDAGVAIEEAQYTLNFIEREVLGI